MPLDILEELGYSGWVYSVVINKDKDIGKR
jgi:hypothetical protein